MLYPQYPLLFCLPPFTLSNKHLPVRKRTALLSPSALQSRCHLYVWSLLTYTYVIKITFLTSHPASGARSIFWGDIRVPGTTQVWFIGLLVFVIKSLAGGSGFVFFFFFFLNTQIYRLSRYVLLWIFLILKLRVTFVHSWRETENLPHQQTHILSTVVLQNTWDSPDADSTVLSEKRTSANRNLSPECFPFSDWLFSLNSILAYGLG